MLEDVDKDGFADLTFRLRWAWGKDDPRKKMLKGDDREWLYAYRITPKGLDSIFPLTDKTRKLSAVIKPASQDVRVWVSELPGSIRENQMIRFTVHAENRSQQAVPISEDLWFTLKAEGVSYGYTSNQSNPKQSLLPGETVVSSVFLYMLPSQYKGDILMEVSFERRSESN
jgi:hypothetical protein